MMFVHPSFMVHKKSLSPNQLLRNGLDITSSYGKSMQTYPIIVCFFFACLNWLCRISKPSTLENRWFYDMSATSMIHLLDDRWWIFLGPVGLFTLSVPCFLRIGHDRPNQSWSCLLIAKAAKSYEFSFR